jgi:hypothetical protein
MARKSYNIEYFSEVEYSENSPTGLIWKNSFRVGNKGSPTPRLSPNAGAFNNQYGYYACTLGKKVYQSALIVWVIAGNKLPEDKNYKIIYKDGNPKNLKIDNLDLEVHESNISKYSDKIREYIEYDESSSTFLRWKKRSSLSSGMQGGSEAGGVDIDSSGYYNVTVGGKRYKTHRLVYWLVTGQNPDGKLIDHIDGNPSNNRIDNLRLGCLKMNMRNRKKGSNNQTGHNGICYSEYYDHRGTLIRKYVYKAYYPCGKIRSFSFSLNKYGEDALTLILNKQKEVVEEISNISGIPYTERHGK